MSPAFSHAASAIGVLALSGSTQSIAASAVVESADSLPAAIWEQDVILNTSPLLIEPLLSLCSIPVYIFLLLLSWLIFSINVFCIFLSPYYPFMYMLLSHITDAFFLYVHILSDILH